MRRYYNLSFIIFLFLFSFIAFASENFYMLEGNSTNYNQTNQNISSVAALTMLGGGLGLGGFLLSNKKYLQSLKSMWFPFLNAHTLKIGNLNIFSGIFNGGKTILGFSFKEIALRFDISDFIHEDNKKLIITPHINIKNIKLLNGLDHFGGIKLNKESKIGKFIDNSIIKSANILKSKNYLTKTSLRGLKAVGKVAVPIGVALDAYFIYDAYKKDGNKIGENTIKEAGSIAGGWTGAIIGGVIAGAAAGAVFGGIGAIPGAIIGGIAGAIIGSGIGEKIAISTSNLLNSVKRKTENLNLDIKSNKLNLKNSYFPVSYKKINFSSLNKYSTNSLVTKTSTNISKSDSYICGTKKSNINKISFSVSKTFSKR